MSKNKIAILGAGNIATALAYHLAKQGNNLHLYCIEPDVEKQINTKHCNHKYMAGVRLPASIKASHEIDKCLDQAKIIIVAVPSHVAVQVLKSALPHIRKDAIILNISKGFDQKTFEPIVMSLKKALPKNMQQHICMLGGPAIATEIVQGSPTAFVVACPHKATRAKITKLMQHDNVKAAQSADLPGVGLVSALKNAYAISLGFCDGLKYSTNAKAFTVTMAINEMSDIMRYSGADPQTASSLAGLGDLLVTGWSPHGRNRTFGEKLVHARTKDTHKLGLTTVEGIRATELGIKLAKKNKIKTPLLSAIHKSLNSKSNFSKPFVDYVKTVKL